MAMGRGRVLCVIGGAFIISTFPRTVNRLNGWEVLFMDACKLTPFGLAVKTELLRRGKSQRWLEKEVTERTGLYVDGGYMYKILTGQREAPKVVTAVKDILSIAENSA